MKEHPVLMSNPMVRAILEGRKTMTRRVIKNGLPIGAKWWKIDDCGDGNELLYRMVDSFNVRTHCKCPYKIGNQLWLKETWQLAEWYSDHWEPAALKDNNCHTTFKKYKADEEIENLKWRPSIFMPRWASRITLEITGVRVERVQDITESEAFKEGAQYHDGLGVGHNGWRHDTEGFVYNNARSSFVALWDSINSKRGFGWDANPWVFVIEFKVIKP